MGLSLAEYAAQHPQHEPEATPEPARSYREQMQEREKVDGLKESILQQLEQGNAPETILYAAIRAIGILTNDTEWTEAGRAALNSVYAGQESLLADNSAAHRREQMQADYNSKLRRQLTRQLNGYRRIESALQDALRAVNATEE